MVAPSGGGQLLVFNRWVMAIFHIDELRDLLDLELGWINEPIYMHLFCPNPDVIILAIFVLGVSVLLAAITLAYGAMQSSIILHKELLSNCLRLPISFYDTTPLGRVVNRFSKDMDSVDTTIPRFIEFWIKCTMHVIGVLFVIILSTPYFTIVVLILGVLYYIIQVCVWNQRG